MYGTHRAILKPDRNQTVVVAGKKRSDSKGGSHHPMGFWYVRDGKFYADLRAPDQWWARVNKDNIGIRGLGGVATKQQLREAVLKYYDDVESHELAL